MIEVMVGQNHCVSFFGWNRHILQISLLPLFRALKESAIDEELKTTFPARVRTCVDEVLEPVTTRPRLKTGYRAKKLSTVIRTCDGGADET